VTGFDLDSDAEYLDWGFSWFSQSPATIMRILPEIVQGPLSIKTPWSEYASELYRPSDRRLSAKRLLTCADRGCHVTDPSGRILSVFWTGAATFLSSSSSVVLTRLSGPRSRPTTLFLLVVPGIEPGPPGSVAKNSDH
jgi:hypothetical protein